MESDSTIFPSSNLNLEPRYFGDELKSLRINNINRVIIGQVNINSIRSKFVDLVKWVWGNTDILMISETKLDASFRTSQFYINGYTSPYRLDRHGKGGGILVYVREDIPSKLISQFLNVEGFFLEINLRKKKWVISCPYNPNNQTIFSHMGSIGKAFDLLSSKYENFLIIGDFNAQASDTSVKHFCDIYSSQDLIKEPTCYKNPNNPKCIDLMLTSRQRSFQNSCVIDTGLFDFHKMTVIVLRSYFIKAEPKIIMYRDYKKFSNNDFRSIINQHK